MTDYPFIVIEFVTSKVVVFLVVVRFQFHVTCKVERCRLGEWGESSEELLSETLVNPD